MASGFSQRLDKSTGSISDDYLLSLKVPRDVFEKIDFDNINRVDPIEALSRFDLRRKMTSTGIFKPIEPFNDL